jgi:CubicO group peptidase (beta-lactamase class C family)
MLLQLLAQMILFSWFTFPLFQPAPAQEATRALPDTPAGRRVEAFLTAFGSGDASQLERFFVASTNPQSAAARPPAQRALRVGAVRQELGSVKLRKVEAKSPESITIFVEGDRGQLLGIGFRFEPGPDCWLAGLTVDEATPEDLAGPAPPMTEQEALVALDRAIEQAVGADEFSGAVLVARRGKPVFQKAWGMASKEFDVPNRPDTKFNLGSINKIFTRIAVAQLVEKGKLTLDDTIGKHLAGYPNREAAAKVTIRQLLEMQSGIGDFFGVRFDSTPKDRFRHNADFLPMFADQPLAFPPGTQRQYSNGSYVVLGEIVARISETDYYDYVRDHIFVPAGMKDTDSYETDVPVANLAEGYTRNWDDVERTSGPRRRNIYTRPARGSAAGGGYSTAPDLLRFTEALVGDRLSSPPYTDWILTGAEPQPGQGGRTGAPAGGGLGIAGGAPGINAALEFDAATGDTIIVMSNYDPPAAMEIAKKARRIIGAISK